MRSRQVGVHGDHQTLSRSSTEQRDTYGNENSCCIASLTILHHLWWMREKLPGVKGHPHLCSVLSQTLLSEEVLQRPQIKVREALQGGSRQRIDAHQRFGRVLTALPPFG